ncbi:MAG: pentapeptide repeat-containing protein [Mariprofundaceae bacterium]|nr:pentapeptide repeat-containing protein [Mariprofundaceae bacterium]
MYLSVEALQQVQPISALTHDDANLPDLNQRIAHIHDDFAFREVVEDLQNSVQLHHLQTSAALASCALLLAQASIQHDFRPKYIAAWQQKIATRKLNALVSKLLPAAHDAISHLCLDGVQLQDCHFKHLRLPFVSLRLADLSQCILSHADLHGGDLRRMNGTACNMTHVDLHESWLDDSHFSWSDLSHADLRKVQATDIDLSGAFLNGSNLSQAILSGANLSSTTLDDANLKHANLFGACLNMARLHGTNLKYTGITPTRLAQAGMAVHANKDTIWGDEKDCAGRNPLAIS